MMKFFLSFILSEMYLAKLAIPHKKVVVIIFLKIVRMYANLGIVIFVSSLAYYRFKLSWCVFTVIFPVPLGLEMMDFVVLWA